MYFGISVYNTQDYTLGDNLAYIKKAGKIGYKVVFTSLHLPEVNYKGVLDDFVEIAKAANENGMELIADISPVTMKTLNASVYHLKPFFEIGIKTLRVDYGFSAEEISMLTRNEYGIKVQINASTLSEDSLERLKKMGADFSRISASHNFYPRPETGLSYRVFVEKSLICKKHGVPVFAFIPSQKGKRGPVYEGLPTLEIHRNTDAEIAAKHLIYTGLVDGAIFGDAYASDQELVKVASIKPEVIEISIKLRPDVTPEEKDIIFLPVHTNRLDAPDDIIRSEESRGYASTGKKIKPNNTSERKAYSVTIDNERYGRYSGELQVLLKDFPADSRVNVVGEIPENERILVNEIKPGKKFRFRKERTI